MGQGKVFFEGSEKKEAFLDQRNIGSENHQNFHILRRLVHGFCQKTEIF